MTPEEIAAAEAAAENADTGDESNADLWAEFEEMDGGTGAGDGTGHAGDDEAGEDDDNQGADFGDGNDAGNAGDDTGANDGTSAAAPANPAWENAPAELRTEFERLSAENAKLLQKERSSTGRATSFQRRYEQLLKDAEPRNVTGDQPSIDAVLSPLKEDYPEIAAPFEQAFGVIQGQMSQLSAAEESRRTAAQADLAEYLNEETDRLTSQHPDYIDVLKANGAQFGAWIDDQPRAVRDAFARNAENIVDAAEAATVIGMFKDFINAPADVPAADRARSPAASSLASRRARQLGATANLSGSNRRPTVTGIPENGDPQAIWEAYDRLDEAAERRR